jgi:hypothetical protein
MFQGRIRPIRLALVYRSGLVAVSISLVLPQAAYVSMVALAAWLA